MIEQLLSAAAIALPSMVPLLLEKFTYVSDNFLHKDKEFNSEIGLLEDTNKVAKATALRKFLEDRFLNTSIESGTDNGLQDRCMDFVKEISRRSVLDIQLKKYAKSYTRTSSTLFVTAILSIPFTIASFILGYLYTDLRPWLLGVGVILILISVVCIATLRVYVVKLNKSKQNEDLR